MDQSRSISTPPAERSGRVHRIEVRPKPGLPDPRGDAFTRHARALGVQLQSASTARVYLIAAPLTDAQVEAVRTRLLTDPVTETSLVGAQRSAAAAVEVHPLPGVMDPAGQSVRAALADLLGLDAHAIDVSTGWRYDLAGVDTGKAKDLAQKILANPVVHGIHDRPYHPSDLPRGKAYSLTLRHVPIRDLTDEQLTKLSRDAHLFLSLPEMQAIRAEYRTLGREPTDIELETLAQTWSEHCVHKTLKSTITYRAPAGLAGDVISWANRPGHTLNADGSVTIHNLLKSTVAAATHELIADGIDWTLSVFKDNSGVIAFDDHWGVCIKVETHNHPSAIEPYGGSATGAGGCIRDVIGTGLGAKPIASTDVFCVAFADAWSASRPLPPGTLHPKRVLTDVVAGVRDYGNRMGIPTVSGAVYFDNRYVGNPLVYCGCIGLIPRTCITGAARPGDRVIALGGRTGRDGIHGATFSSTELEGTSADEFSHAVQIGNAIEEKRVLDAILRARDEFGSPLFTAITDCGAGGFSSAVGEMGAKIGAEIHLERAPLKYDGLSYTEIWISEAQERMVLAVPPQNIDRLREICVQEHVELADLGVFGTQNREIILNYKGTEVGRLPCDFLHDGLPQPTRDARWNPAPARATTDLGSRATTELGSVVLSSSPAPTRATTELGSVVLGSPIRRETGWASAALKSLLAHPTIASKHWIIRQYDHEVQGATLVKPLVGPKGRGPGDASVIEPLPGKGKGLAISCGLQTGMGDPDLPIPGDPYLMTLAAIDECVRNLVCVGADPARTAILDNFCWPSCQKPENLASLVRASEACYDGAKAYRTPFVSGKDSLNNQLKYTDPATGKERVIEIPPTLLITGIGIVHDVRTLVTMDAKSPDSLLLAVGPATSAMGGSHLQKLNPELVADHSIPRTDLTLGPRTARAVADLIRAGLVRSAHDVSDGGLLVALAEMLIAAPAGIGARVDLSAWHADTAAAAFGEGPSQYLLEIAPDQLPRVLAALGSIPHASIGAFNSSGRLTAPDAGVDEPVEALAEAWLAPLDW